MSYERTIYDFFNSFALFLAFHKGGEGQSIAFRLGDAEEEEETKRGTAMKQFFSIPAIDSTVCGYLGIFPHYPAIVRYSYGKILRLAEPEICRIVVSVGEMQGRYRPCSTEVCYRICADMLSDLISKYKDLPSLAAKMWRYVMSVIEASGGGDERMVMLLRGSAMRAYCTASMMGTINPATGRMMAEDEKWNIFTRNAACPYVSAAMLGTNKEDGDSEGLLGISREHSCSIRIYRDYCFGRIAAGQPLFGRTYHNVAWFLLDALSSRPIDPDAFLVFLQHPHVVDCAQSMLNLSRLRVDDAEGKIVTFLTDIIRDREGDGGGETNIVPARIYPLPYMSIDCIEKRDEEDEYRNAMAEGYFWM